jgi:hypothetical protein|tara:strand:- start:18628 stop:18870 length:243 start_codon:yes stop_codon:yes gene_type:complete
MVINIEKLKSKLETNIVLITFESLKSGKVYSREYTLNEKYMEVPNHIKNQSGDTLICYDVEFKKWEDLQLYTIQQFKVVQ